MSKSKKRHSKNKLLSSLNARPRNPYVNHPLMQKGGAHQKSKSACRAATRRELKCMTRDWSSYFFSFLFNLQSIFSSHPFND
jgi:hypothetical protein